LDTLVFLKIRRWEANIFEIQTTQKGDNITKGTYMKFQKSPYMSSPIHIQSANEYINSQETMVCSQTAIYELRHKILTPKKRDVIATTPLAELLKIGNVQIRHKTCKKVADTYNPEWNGFVFGDELQHIH
jgi:hypothetical protein